jgi:hypothetical protein
MHFGMKNTLKNNHNHTLKHDRSHPVTPLSLSIYIYEKMKDFCI